MMLLEGPRFALISQSLFSGLMLLTQQALLVLNMMNLNRDAVLKVLVAMNANCANVTDPVLPQEQADVLLRMLAEDILVMPTTIIITVLSRFRMDITLVHLEGAVPLVYPADGVGTVFYGSAVTGSCASNPSQKAT